MCVRSKKNAVIHTSATDTTRYTDWHRNRNNSDNDVAADSKTK